MIFFYAQVFRLNKKHEEFTPGDQFIFTVKMCSPAKNILRFPGDQQPSGKHHIFSRFAVIKFQESVR